MERYQKEGLLKEEYDKISSLMGREPNDMELAMFGVMWSEHCSYKNSRALLKHFWTKNERVLQGPGENAGIVDIGDNLAICMKIESHNHPSAVEPFQGAATGVGGIVRDIFVMGARPIALLNSIRFGDLSREKTKKLVDGVVKGIADYGNKIGIPDVSGETVFNSSYNDNPLVNAMCVGILPSDKIKKGTASGEGNPLLLVGHTTGRDGIKGASFASENLTSESEEKRSHVQVADPFMEKLLLEAALELIDHGDIIGLQDLGAAGLTSSSCEMAARGDSGLIIDVSHVITREEGMTPLEIMLSESQERMLVVLKKGKEKDAFKIFEKWDLHATQIGEVTSDGFLTIKEKGKVVARIPAKALAEESPANLRPFKFPSYIHEKNKQSELDKIIYNENIEKDFLELLTSPNICSKEWVYRQYDHMVGASTAVKPGGDASVVFIRGTKKAISLTVDCNARYCYLDPYEGAKASVFESARNIAATGALPIAVTDCLNFASPEEEEQYFQFRNSVFGITDACKLLNTPVIGGNVSFYNQSNDHAIYPSPVIGMLGLIEDNSKITGIGFQNYGDEILIIGDTKPEMGGTEYLSHTYKKEIGPIPKIEPQIQVMTIKTLIKAIQNDLVKSAHDISDGGIAVALAESCFSGNTGVDINIRTELKYQELLFSETQGRFILSCNPQNTDKLIKSFQKSGIYADKIGKVIENKFIIHINNSTIIEQNSDSIKKLWKDSFECQMK